MLKKLWYSVCVSCRPHRSRTVRLAFPLVIIATIFAGAAVITSSNQSFVSIETEPTSVRKGEQFFILVKVTAHTPVNAIDIEIQYPESQMEITGIDTGESVITLWTEEPYANGGIIKLTGGTFQKGFLGEHIIARVRAVATETGAAYVSKNTATFIAGDGLGTEILVSESESDATQVFIANADGSSGSLVGTVSVHIVTDVDGDGDVDIKDISAFMVAWFNKSSIFDFNGDGRMTIRDFSILLADSFFK